MRWEAALLAELGYGLDLAACAVTGATPGWPSSRRAPAGRCRAAAAGVWRARLLRLPRASSAGADAAGPADWRDGLRLTGHFLARDAFGHQHRPLPAARQMLYDRVAGPGCRIGVARHMLRWTDA